MLRLKIVSHTIIIARRVTTPLQLSSPAELFLNNVDDSEKTFNFMMENVTQLKHYNFSSIQTFTYRYHNLLILTQLHVNKYAPSKKNLTTYISSFVKLILPLVSFAFLKPDKKINNLLNLNGDNFVNSPTNAGGVGMHASSNINYNLTKFFEIENDGCENIWIKVQNESNLSLVGAIYRHPNSNTNEFTKSLDLSLSKINQPQAKCVILGDINIAVMDNKPRSQKHEIITSIIQYICQPQMYFMSYEINQQE